MSSTVKATFILAPDSPDVTIGVQTGDAESFEIAKSKIVKAFTDLGQTIPNIQMIGEPEQHSHDPVQVVVERRRTGTGPTFGSGRRA